jgi:hypothetical protein
MPMSLRQARRTAGAVAASAEMIGAGNLAPARTKVLGSRLGSGNIELRNLAHARTGRAAGVPESSRGREYAGVAAWFERS